LNHAGNSLLGRVSVPIFHKLICFKGSPAMKTAFVALLIVAVALTGFGLYGVFDYWQSKPGWERARAEARPLESGGGPLAQALKDENESLERSRDIALTVSLLSLAGGLALGTWTWRSYLRGSQAASPGFGSTRPSEDICTICGARLNRKERTRGVCDFCQKRAG
jgi:hypothetical protein